MHYDRDCRFREVPRKNPSHPGRLHKGRSLPTTSDSITIMADAPPSYIGLPAPDYSATATAGGSDALPSYGASESPFIPSPHIDDKLPNHFKINGQYTPTLLRPSDLQAHLILLGAFHRLREEVRTQKGKDDIPMQPDERWAVFLQRAVFRFECWADRMIGMNTDDEETTRVLTPLEVPPLDAMMVWHTYMLNPTVYHEDCLRKFQGLYKIG